ncbi:transcription-repair coupling factor [bacterium]|nr:transcription-repair coupling factor [bacterium]
MTQSLLHDTIRSALLSRLHDLSIFADIKEDTSLSLKGLSGSLKSAFLSLVRTELDRPLLVCVPGREAAETLADELESFLPAGTTAFFPGGHEEKNTPLIVNPRRAGLQMRTLQGLLDGSLGVVVTSGVGLCQPLPPPEDLSGDMIRIGINATRDLHSLVEQLVDFGYVREIIAERPGEISLRGGILDIFPFTGEKPHRFEFFGDTIDSVRTYDPETQLSTGTSDGLELVPAVTHWTNRASHLPAFLQKNALLFLEDPELIAAEVEAHLKSDGSLTPWEDASSSLAAFQRLTFSTLSSRDDERDIGGREQLLAGTAPEQIRVSLEELAADGTEVLLLAITPQHADRLRRYLDLTENPISGVAVDTGSLERGFRLKPSRLAVFTEDEIYRRKQRTRPVKKIELGVPIRELSSLRPGDFVVHIDHGIGRYRELTIITTGGIARECLTIEYQDRDKLYVPVEKMDRVQKYAGKEGVVPQITKLGSGTWERTKEKTKKSIEKIAKDLIRLYSIRQTKPGFAFSAKTAWEAELEDTFVWEETPDQASAIRQVTEDMEKPRPMDRLICGDVGYGKTEVAVRAAFKCVNNGKQAAILVPTTILAQQHARTFRERLADFPVQIEELSRFRSKPQQTAAVERIKDGRSDIIIGTHRLLSSDVQFKDLGLLIIDEEQRFGVRHKEKLKSFRETVDVLTLSATPIPRTLHFSLMGVRDMSLITTPPKDRQPIITEVAPFQEELIREAIERELARDGQIFFVHNRIRSIHAVARMLREIVPGLTLAVAHGRMHSDELEQVMIAFTNGEYQCLVSTMIIGSGVDLPHVNTLIVHRADQLGLAQLYQLRGRVGRSDRRAYAYLLTPPFRQLSFDAVKRLRTIEEFTELGAGFQIAMKDLEIRGAGNLLGTQQSGNMNAVGFDLYNRLVSEAVRELKEHEGIEERTVRAIDCQVDFREPSYFPESYIPDESLRVTLYHRLHACAAETEIDRFQDELKDRFGAIPVQGLNLLEVARMRILGSAMGLQRIIFNTADVMLVFDEHWVDSFPDTELFSKKLRSMIESAPAPIRFLQKKTFGLRIETGQADALAIAKKVLHSWT